MSQQRSVIGAPWHAISAERLELGEGARAHGDGFVAVDLLAGRLLRVQDHTVSTLLTLDVPLGAVAPRVDGGWIAAAGVGIALLEDDGSLQWLAEPEAAAPVAMRMNDGVADPHGRFWAGSMPYDGTPGAGSLYRVDPDLSVTRVLGGLSIPNGPAFDATGSVMYLADSARGLIQRYAVDIDSGDLAAPTTFVELDGVAPDGMVVDADGFLWSALWGGSRLHRYAPDGALAEVVAVPATQPTSVALSAGPRAEMLITTAAVGLEATGDEGRLLLTEVSVGGLATCVFGVPATTR